MTSFSGRGNDGGLFALWGHYAVNGGVLVDYTYSRMTLSNSADEILLLRPDGSEEDRVVWGRTSELRTTPGKSLERTGFATSH